MTYERKTQKTEASVDDYVAAVEPEEKRKDCEKILELMRTVTGDQGAMWGTSLIGFGDTSYTYASGQQTDFFLTGFSPRKRNITIYIMSDFDRHEDLLGRLGKHSTGKACLYVNRLSDIDFDMLEQLVRESVVVMQGSSSQQKA